MFVHWSVGPAIHWSVLNAFVKIAETDIMQDEDASCVVYTALFSPSGHFFMRLTEKIYLITLLKSGLTEKGKGGREEGRRRN